MVSSSWNRPAQDQALRVVDFLPYPEQLYLEVCGLIFPGRKDDGDDDL